MAAFLPQAFEDVPKTFRAGTHRTRAPRETFEHALMLSRAMGVTRVADVTGLDCIGVPVAMAYRPNARSLAVSPGKGLDLVAAKTSALMESIESWHAERIHLPLVLASMNELAFERPMVDMKGLPKRAGGALHENVRMLWIEATNLLKHDGAHDKLWVPFELVHMNFALPLPTASGALLSSSNGLASGNHLLEAVSHAICEIVERDALTMWRAVDEATRQAHKIDLATVADQDCQWVLDRFEAAGCAFAAWDVTSNVGIPTYRCLIVDRDPSLARSCLPGVGTGCHPSRAVALLRALTEAAQTRLTMISGARDDLSTNQYAKSFDPQQHATMLESIEGTSGTRRFQDGVTFEADTLNADVTWELEQLRKAGISQVAAIDLTKPAFNLPVVRVVIPGLEGIPDATGYIPGRRYREAVTS
jgi:YcaO-like protein with predicted kinase domain